MTTKTRKLAKQAAGSVISNGGSLTVIDEWAITARRVEVACKRCGQVREIDITRAVKMAIDEVARGALSLPAGDYHAVVNIGHSGQVLSAQLVKD